MVANERSFWIYTEAEESKLQATLGWIYEVCVFGGWKGTAGRKKRARSSLDNHSISMVSVLSIPTSSSK